MHDPMGSYVGASDAVANTSGNTLKQRSNSSEHCLSSHIAALFYLFLAWNTLPAY